MHTGCPEYPDLGYTCNTSIEVYTQIGNYPQPVIVNYTASPIVCSIDYRARVPLLLGYTDHE